MNQSSTNKVEQEKARSPSGELRSTYGSKKNLVVKNFFELMFTKKVWHHMSACKYLCKTANAAQSRAQMGNFNSWRAQSLGWMPQIGRAVQQECRDRSRMPSSA
eukprot:TRINITY_DN71998_c0_g1_i1.p1 TRINITY_DN71998_c0_g1~~TRINITY_DN71998_c0_g1_i1.p1  ORF type:complete len:104 (+),score=9.11 TRINITY_DN71998_c0_g1_i1:160-471(+)